MLIIQCGADGWNHSIKAVHVQQAHHAGQAKDDRIDNAYFKRLGGYISTTLRITIIDQKLCHVR